MVHGAEALPRLQRILLLRELGLGLPAIADVLEGHRDHAAVLGEHLQWLRREEGRLRDQIRSVQGTIEKLKRGEEPVANEMFKGFDHTQYREEVTERWGKASYDSGNRWWSAMTEEARAVWKTQTQELNEAWADAARPRSTSSDWLRCTCRTSVSRPTMEASRVRPWSATR